MWERLKIEGQAGLSSEIQPGVGDNEGLDLCVCKGFQPEHFNTIGAPLTQHRDFLKRRAEIHSIHRSNSHKSAWVLQYNTVFILFLNYLTVSFFF